MAASASGARGAAQAQRNALEAQTAIDRINARSAASSLEAQANLDTVNAKADFNSTNTQAIYDTLIAQNSALEIRNSAAESSLELRNNAAIGTAKAKASAESLTTGAAISDVASQFSELQAQSALLTGQHDEQMQRLQAAQVKSKQTATLAARGVDLGEGSPLNVLTGTDLVGENAAIAIQQKTMLQAFGYRTQSMNQRTDAEMKRSSAALTLAAADLESRLGTARADAILANAGTRADAIIANVNAAAETKKALASAGLANAEAAAEVKRTLARGSLDNAEAASGVKDAQAGAIDPDAAEKTSLITNAGQVAGSWYMYGKAR